MERSEGENPQGHLISRKMRMVISRAAEADVADAYLWYENNRPGLGSEFLTELHSAVEAVIYEPLRFPLVHRTVRRALVHRFPYGLFFVAMGGEIVVIAVMHLARNPRRISQRQIRKT